MYSFETVFAVNSHDCDKNGVLKPSGYLKYMQEAANIHCERTGFGYDDCLSRGTAFLLSRVALDVYEPVRAYDEVVCRTCPAAGRGVSFNRFTAMYKNGRQVALLTSVWALIRLSDRGILRVSEADYTLPTGDMPETRAPLYLRIPKDTAFEECGDYPVRYSVCDRNRHFNNTRYPDMFCDLAGDLSGKMLTALSVSYLAEAPEGETLRVFRAPAPTPEGLSGQALYFKAFRQSDGKLCCEAMMSEKEL